MTNILYQAFSQNQTKYKVSEENTPDSKGVKILVNDNISITISENNTTPIFRYQGEEFTLSLVKTKEEFVDHIIEENRHVILKYKIVSDRNPPLSNTEIKKLCQALSLTMGIMKKIQIPYRAHDDIRAFVNPLKYWSMYIK